MSCGAYTERKPASEVGGKLGYGLRDYPIPCILLVCWEKVGAGILQEIRREVSFSLGGI